MVIVSGALIALFIILLSLPNSKLAQIFLKIFGIVNLVIAALLVLYVISPVDLIPDVIPIAGQTDDAATFVGVIVDAAIGYISLRKSLESRDTKSEDKN